MTEKSDKAQGDNTRAVSENTKALQSNTSSRDNTRANQKIIAASNVASSEANARTADKLQETVSKQGGLIKILVLFAIFKMSLIIGLAIIILNLSDTVDQQGEAVDRTDKVVQAVTSDTARRAGQVNIYRIFYGQCEGRFLIKPELKSDPDTQKAIQDCADSQYSRNVFPPDQR